MRRIYILFAMVFMASTVMAQIEVTFAVDMNGETISANGVHVAGDWQSEANGGDDWQPGENMLTDDDSDGIYTLTVNIPAGSYQYKYINDNNWGGVEGVPAVSQVGFGNDNRYFTVTENGNTLYAVPFSGSAMAGMSAVKLIVDMTEEVVDTTGAHVAGDIITPNWTPNATPLTNLSNNYWGVTIQVADGSYQYKFLKGSEWGSDESVTGDCAAGGNRVIDVAGDAVTTAFCFTSCEACVPPVDPIDVTFKVDMSLFSGDLTPGVNVAGTFNGWSLDNPMDDSDGDMVYEITIGLQPGYHEYKFRVNDDWEGSQRSLTVVEGEPQILDLVCFSWPVPCPAEIFDPADVTFRVDVSQQELEPGDFVWVMGDFTDPTWQGGALQMTDEDNDGIWEVTFPNYVEQIGFYKFAIGDAPNGTTWTEESADFSSIGGCGMDNGSFSDNRFLQRMSADPMMVCFGFDNCDPCVLSLQEAENLSKVQVYPNPIQGMLFVAFDQAGDYIVQVMDVTGKLVSTATVNGTQAELNVDALNSGVYFVQITDAYNNVVTRKVVK